MVLCMNILHVWDGDYPWDIRVNKISESLVAAGHQVHIACRNKKRLPGYEFYNGYHVHRMPFLPENYGRLNDAAGFPAFFNPLWVSHIKKTCSDNSCSLIIARDLPLAPTAVWVANRLKIPCILDMAECYPEMLRCIWKFEKKKIGNIFLRNPLLADAVEKAVISSVDRIWVMIDESKERLINKGVAPEKIDIVSNTPVLSRFVAQARSDERRAKLELVYVGLLNPSRGLDTTLRGLAAYVRNVSQDVHLTIIGTGKAEKDLKALCRDLALESQVTFRGWVDNTLVPQLISNADVGIVPHHKCGHWDTTIPNKLFDYMAAGKPVIVSNAEPIARIVSAERVGLVYRDFDEDDLCRALREVSSQDIREGFGKNGRSAVESKYNWLREEKVMIESLDSMLKS
jgi:glycosyltransferase involved in cell wall biosynthesis